LIYLLLLALFKPVLFVLSVFRQKRSGALVIQSAKIGDYINTSVMFEALGSCDVAIESINAPFAKNDARIEKVWILDGYKRTLIGRLALGFGIFWRGYENIYVATPNNLNLFLALIGQSRISTFRHYKTGKTATMLLGFCDFVGVHTKDDLTLDTYLHLIDKNLTHKQINKNPILYKSTPTLPLSFESSSKKVGVALSAGNKIKEIGINEWGKIFALLDNYECEIHIFGVESEKKLLAALIEKTKAKDIVSHLGKVSLELLPFAISKMDLFVASDTAGVYISDAYQIPTIVYAGPCYMPEQHPINKVLIVASNAPCVPFSFIFNAPYHKKCDGLYDTTDAQQEKIAAFIKEVLA
jgi:ADP-heptose:LPS heptosyltransferase